MKIVVTGGGTAGHVTPLLAVASEITNQLPTARIRYVGKYGDTMSKAVGEHPSVEKEYKIAAGKLRRFHGKPFYWYLTQPGLVLHNIKDAALFVLGFLQSIIVLLFWRPEVVFVKGGYVGLPVGLAAACLRIPIVTHDSDALPGLTNRILSRYASALAVGAPVYQYPQYATKNLHFTGVPVREEFLHAPSANTAKQQLGIPNDAQVVAIVGGSLGAVRINEAATAVLDELIGAHNNIVLYWATGAHGHASVVRAIEQKPYKDRIILVPFTQDLPAVFSAASAVVTRAGATTLAELAIMHKPTVIIPNPLLTGGHQTKNAQMLAQQQAAIVITEVELAKHPEQLVQAVHSILSNHQMRASLAQNLGKFASPDSARQIATLIITTVKGT